jgi:hypothetical protein
MYGLFSSPIKHDHAESFFGITLLETSGDYFDLYWDNDASGFFKNRRQIFSFVQSNEIKGPELNQTSSGFIVYQQRMTDVYLYEAVGLLMSIFLFYSLITSIIKKTKYRKFLLASFLGMAVLLFHSITGIPKNNFDPLVGDTFKPLYYSFVLIFSFSILIATKLSEKYKNTFNLAIYLILIIFILGFPKNAEFVPDINMIQKIQSSLFCPVEKIVYLDSQDFSSVNCGVNNISQNINIESNLYINKIQHKPINFLFITLNLLTAIYLVFRKKLSKNRRLVSIVKE